METTNPIGFRVNVDQMIGHLPVVDITSLEDNGIDNELFKDLSSIYLKQTPEILRNIKDQMNFGRIDYLRKLAHNLKGTSLNLGAARIAELSRLIESSTPASSPLELRHLITCLEKEFQETEFWMNRFNEQQ